MMSSSSTRVMLGALAIAMALLFAVALPCAKAQPSPAPAPTNDGTAIDQGIAYVLMFIALALTYLIHTMDGSYGSYF